MATKKYEVIGKGFWVAKPVVEGEALPRQTLVPVGGTVALSEEAAAPMVERKRLRLVQTRTRTAKAD